MRDDFSDIKPEDWIPASQAFRPAGRPKAEPVYDKVVSNAVGFPVRANDIRLLKKVAEWKRGKNPDAPDLFLNDPRKVEELRHILR